MHHPFDSAAADAQQARLLDRAMDEFSARPPALPLAVALSGGADSTALLLACAERWPGQVTALHVHHGLQAAADAFEHHCTVLCNRLNIPLRIARVDARHAPGQSPEDAARRKRYQALSDLLQAGSQFNAINTVVIGHHADDQVETVLLALSRGAGLPGLAAMPAHWRRGSVAYSRPLLGVPAQAVRAWLRGRGETWVEDPSNADERFARNRLRARLLPALQAAFPHFRFTFARSAAHAAQAQQVLDEVAMQDLAACGIPPRIDTIQALSRPRQANLLRHWLTREHGARPSSAQLEEVLDQLAACRTRGHRLDLKVGPGRLQRQGAALTWSAEKGMVND